MSLKICTDFIKISEWTLFISKNPQDFISIFPERSDIKKENLETNKIEIAKVELEKVSGGWGQ